MVKPGAEIDDASRSRTVRRILAVVLVLNLAVAVAKLVVGWSLHQSRSTAGR